MGAGTHSEVVDLFIVRPRRSSVAAPSTLPDIKSHRRMIQCSLARGFPGDYICRRVEPLPRTSSSLSGRILYRHKSLASLSRELPLLSLLCVDKSQWSPM